MNLAVALQSSSWEKICCAEKGNRKEYWLFSASSYNTGLKYSQCGLSLGAPLQTMHCVYMCFCLGYVR